MKKVFLSWLIPLALFAQQSPPAAAPDVAVPAAKPIAAPPELARAENMPST